MLGWLHLWTRVQVYLGQQVQPVVHLQPCAGRSRLRRAGGRREGLKKPGAADPGRGATAPYGQSPHPVSSAATGRPGPAGGSPAGAPDVAPAPAPSSGGSVWLAPLAAGIFAGAVGFDVLPIAVSKAGVAAGVWVLVGLAAFLLAQRVLSAFGHERLTWPAVLAMWIHSFLEGMVAATGYALSLTLGAALSIGLLAHLIPESTALVALLVGWGLSLRQALARTSGLVVAVVAGMLAARYAVPGLSRAALGAALAFGAGGLLYLALGSWRGRRAGFAGSLAIAAAGAALMGLPAAIGVVPAFR